MLPPSAHRFAFLFFVPTFSSADIMSAFLRRHVELIPLAAVVGAGVVMAAGFIGDVATNGYMLSYVGTRNVGWCAAAAAT